MKFKINKTSEMCAIVPEVGETFQFITSEGAKRGIVVVDSSTYVCSQCMLNGVEGFCELFDCLGSHNGGVAVHVKEIKE